MKQQLQKWHRRNGTSSIPMVPLKEMSVKSGKRRNKENLDAPLADPDKSSFKRTLVKNKQAKVVQSRFTFFLSKLIFNAIRTLDVQ